MSATGLLMRRLGVLLLLVGLAHPMLAFELDDCDGAYERLLHRERQSMPEARAVTADQERLYWPNQDHNGRFRLLYSAHGALTLRVGERAIGADASELLSSTQAGVPSALRYLGETGIVLDLNGAERMPTWLSGQVVVTKEDGRGRLLAFTGIQHARFLDAYYGESASKLAFGATTQGDEINFRLWAPTAVSVAVCLYPSAQQPARAVHAMASDPQSGSYQLSLSYEHAKTGAYYRYLLDVYVPGTGLVRQLVTDPYSVSLSANSDRSQVLDLADASTKPNGWENAPRARELKNNVDMQIYELHVRDFSVSDESVRPLWRGKYLAFDEAESNGVQHLKTLAKAGITDIHLLPVFDLASVPERDCSTPQIALAAAADSAPREAVLKQRADDCFNWGYDPFHFGALEGSYALEPDGASRVREFRSMVLALNRLGLRVGMDVVYNHTAASGQQRQSVLDRIVPGYYHRRNADGAIERSTCCENTATEHRMMAKLMIDTAIRFARDYRIDSFRFDLMGHQPRDAMIELAQQVNAATGRQINLLGEGWNFGEVANGARFVQAAQGQLAGTAIATFSDRARDAARGGGCCDAIADAMQRHGWLSGYAWHAQDAALVPSSLLLQSSDLVRVGLLGSLSELRMRTFDGTSKTLAELRYGDLPAGYVRDPNEVVNYVENHDNATLFDLMALKLPIETPAHERARVQVLGIALVTLSQGVAYFHAGMELMRSKSFDRNSYNSGDWFNRIDYARQQNFFPAGLPIAGSSAAQVRQEDALLKPLLSSVAVSKADIEHVFAMFKALSSIRAGTRLLRLSDQQAIATRVQQLNLGPGQVPGVLAAVINGEELAGEPARLLYAINADVKAHTIELSNVNPELLVLHPALVNQDPRLVEARLDSKAQRLTVPARSVLVYLQARADD